MNDRNLDQLLTAWLELGPSSAPDRVADAARLEARRTRQTAALSWWPTRRFPLMNNAAKFGLGAAVVVVAALLGFNYLVAPNVGAPGLDDPTVTPTPTPVPLLGTSDLEPGAYTIGRWFPVQFDLTITDSWETWGAGNRVNRIWKPCQPSPCEGYSAILTFEIVGNVISDPCNATQGPRIGEGVDDLVSALTTLPGFEAGPVTDVSIDGYVGKSFELTFVGPTEGCVEGGSWQWVSEEPVYWGTGARQRVIVLDVDGTRLVVDEVMYSGDRVEMDAIVDSIDFH